MPRLKIFIKHFSANDNYDININLHFFLTAATNGVVLATEKKHKSILYDEHSINKVEMITKNIGMVYSGMGPDYR